MCYKLCFPHFYTVTRNGYEYSLFTLARTIRFRQLIAKLTKFPRLTVAAYKVKQMRLLVYNIIIHNIVRTILTNDKHSVVFYLI